MNGRVIAFASPLGGVGQTSLLANIATALAMRDVACWCVDLCHQNALGSHLGLAARAKTGWTSALAAGHWSAQLLERSAMGVPFLPYGCMTPDHTYLLERMVEQQPNWLAQRIAEADPSAGALLLDVPAWPHPLARQALSCADVCLLAVDVSPRSALAYDHMRTVQGLLPPGASCAVVATRFDPRRASHRPAYIALRQAWGSMLAPHPVHADDSVPQALAQFSCAVHIAPDSQAAHDMQGIATWLLAGMPEQTAAEPP